MSQPRNLFAFSFSLPSGSRGNAHNKCAYRPTALRQPLPLGRCQETDDCSRNHSQTDVVLSAFVLVL